MIAIKGNASEDNGVHARARESAVLPFRLKDLKQLLLANLL